MHTRQYPSRMRTTLLPLCMFWCPPLGVSSKGLIFGQVLYLETEYTPHEYSAGQVPYLGEGVITHPMSTLNRHASENIIFPQLLGGWQLTWMFCKLQMASKFRSESLSWFLEQLKALKNFMDRNSQFTSPIMAERYETLS